MEPTRRCFIKKAIAVSGSLLVTAPAWRASRASCSSAETDVRSANHGDGQIFTITDWHVGDCELRNFSIIVAGNGDCLWHGEVCTHRTHTHDIWNMRVRIATYTGEPNPPLLLDQTHTGPRMSEQDYPLWHPWDEHFHVDPKLVRSGMDAYFQACC